MNDRKLMKQQTQRKPMDEREKLRKFRELDDAFAEALRELDNPDGRSRMPDAPSEATAPPLEEHEAPRQKSVEANVEKSVEQSFEERLRALMQEYQKPAEQVAELLVQLKAMGRIV
jgi:hypothetical protein